MTIHRFSCCRYRKWALVVWPAAFGANRFLDRVSAEQAVQRLADLTAKAQQAGAGPSGAAAGARAAAVALAGGLLARAAASGARAEYMAAVRGFQLRLRRTQKRDAWGRVISDDDGSDSDSPEPPPQPGDPAPEPIEHVLGFRPPSENRSETLGLFTWSCYDFCDVQATLFDGGGWQLHYGESEEAEEARFLAHAGEAGRRRTEALREAAAAAAALGARAEVARGAERALQPLAFAAALPQLVDCVGWEAVREHAAAAIASLISREESTTDPLSGMAGIRTAVCIVAVAAGVSAVPAADVISLAAPLLERLSNPTAAEGRRGAAKAAEAACWPDSPPYDWDLPGRPCEDRAITARHKALAAVLPLLLASLSSASAGAAAAAPAEGGGAADRLVAALLAHPGAYPAHPVLIPAERRLRALLFPSAPGAGGARALHREAARMAQEAKDAKAAAAAGGRVPSHIAYFTRREEKSDSSLDREVSQWVYHLAAEAAASALQQRQGASTPAAGPSFSAWAALAERCASALEARAAAGPADWVVPVDTRGAGEWSGGERSVWRPCCRDARALVAFLGDPSAERLNMRFESERSLGHFGGLLKEQLRVGQGQLSLRAGPLAPRPPAAQQVQDGAAAAAAQEARPAAPAAARPAAAAAASGGPQRAQLTKKKMRDGSASAAASAAQAKAIRDALAAAGPAVADAAVTA